MINNKLTAQHIDIILDEKDSEPEVKDGDLSVTNNQKK